MSLLLHRPLLTCSTAALGLSGATFAFLSHQRRNPLRLDSAVPSTSQDFSSSASNPKNWSFNQYQRDAKTPVVNKRGGLNAKAVRQITTGSVLGLVAGLALSLFSKPLTLLLGLGFLGVHTAEKRLGVSLIPYETLQKYVKGVNLRSAVQDDAALKVSFAVMVALTGFASF